MAESLTSQYINAFRAGLRLDYQTWLGQRQAGGAEMPAAPARPLPQPPLSGLGGKANVLHGRQRSRRTSSRRSIDTGLKGRPDGKQPGNCLPRVGDAWDEFQTSRKRDAVYGFLAAVFHAVQELGALGPIRKRARRGLRRLGLRLRKSGDIFAAVIRHAAGDAIDSKEASRLSRVLRYAARYKRNESLKAFIKKRGGLNGVAARYAARLGRGRKATQG
jgi:hypothetical protein